MESYEDVQRSIVRGDQLELFDDVERLIPDHIKPQCLQVVLEPEPEPSDSDSDKRKKKGPIPKRKKRDDDVYRNIPKSAHSGFVSVKDLLMKSKKTKAPKELGPLGPEAIEDNASDVDIENGPTVAPTKKSTSRTKKARTSYKKMSTAEIDPSAIEDRVSDEEIANGPLAELAKRKRSSKASSSKPSKRRKRSIEANDVEHGDDSDTNEHVPPNSSPRLHDENDIPIQEDDLEDPANANGVPDLDSLTRASMLHSDPYYSLTASLDKSMHIPLSSPPSPSKQLRLPKAVATAQVYSSLPAPRSPFVHSATQGSVDASWLLEDMDASDSEVVLPLQEQASNRRISEAKQSTPKRPISSPFDKKRLKTTQTSMFGSPSSPHEMRTSIPLSTSLDHSSSIRPKEKAGRVRKRLVIESSPVTSTTPSPRFKKRIRRKDETAASNERRRRQNEFFIRNMDMEAAHSGGEISEGGSGSDSEERSSDREFLQPLAETQMDADYNQDYVYRLGLCTQIPADVDGPKFANGPRRAGRFAGGRVPVPQASITPTTLTRNLNTSDDYEFGTFVVRDSDPLVLESSTSSDF